MKEIQPGIYRHFKGGVYEVLGVAKHSEHPEEEFVVYRSQEHGTLWIRPRGMFDDLIERTEYSGPRFTRID